MKNLIFSLFAITLAGIAAIAATTAMLNTPVHHIGPATPDKKPESTPPSSTTPESAPAPATPAASGDKPASPAPSAENKPAAEDEKEDKDPYEGIAPEELPPDLQYDADASVSFPTNT